VEPHPDAGEPDGNHVLEIDGVLLASCKNNARRH
jgi:hypothetical protein